MPKLWKVLPTHWLWAAALTSCAGGPPSPPSTAEPDATRTPPSRPAGSSVLAEPAVAATPTAAAAPLDPEGPCPVVSHPQLLALAERVPPLDRSRVPAADRILPQTLVAIARGGPCAFTLDGAPWEEGALVRRQVLAGPHVVGCARGPATPVTQEVVVSPWSPTFLTFAPQTTVAPETARRPSEGTRTVVATSRAGPCRFELDGQPICVGTAVALEASLGKHVVACNWREIARIGEARVDLGESSDQRLIVFGALPFAPRDYGRIERHDGQCIWIVDPVCAPSGKCGPYRSEEVLCPEDGTAPPR